MIFTLVSIIQDHLESVLSRIKDEKDEAKKLAAIELQKEEEKKVCLANVISIVGKFKIL